MKVRVWADFGSGLLFLGIGAAAIVIAQSYPFGTASQMGPGYVPILLAGALVLIGIALVVRSMLFADAEAAEAGESSGPIFAFRAALSVLGAVLVFALIVDRAGLAVASIVLVLIARTAAPDYRLREVLITAFCLSALCVGLFVYSLGMPVAAFPF